MSRQFPALRGVAILLVVVNHAITLTMGAAREYGLPPAPAWERVLLVGLRELGLIAVPIFLFLSGYFAVYAMKGRATKAALRSVQTSLKHMLIPYLLWSVVFYLVLYALLDQVYQPIEYFKFLLVGYPFNFVPLLVLFYLISPLLVRAAGRAPLAVLLAFGLYQLFLIFVLAPGQLGVALPEWAARLAPPVLRLTFAIWGIFFPLGVVFSLHERGIAPALGKVWPLLAAGALTLYVATALEGLGIISAPMAGLLFPVLVIPILPLVRRDRIPQAGHLEQLGRNAYALYLTNLVLISLVLEGARRLAPGLLSIPLLLAALAGAVAIIVPSLMATALQRSRRPALRVYVFG